MHILGDVEIISVDGSNLIFKGFRYENLYLVDFDASVLCWPKQIHVQQLKCFTSAHNALLRMGVSNLFAGLTRATKLILLKHNIFQASNQVMLNQSIQLFHSNMTKPSMP